MDNNTQQNLNAPTISNSDKAPPSPKYPLLYTTELNVGRNNVSLAFPWTAWERGPRYEAGEMFPKPAVDAANITDTIAWLTDEDAAEALAEIITRISRKVADSVRDEVIASGLDINSIAGAEKYKSLFEKYMQELTVARETIAALNKNNTNIAAEMAAVSLDLSLATAAYMEAMNGDDKQEADKQKVIRDTCERELFAKALVYRRNAASIQLKRRSKEDENVTEQAS